MHAWDVITHGGGEGLVYVFNAVAAIFNGKGKTGIGSLAATLIFVSGAFGTIIATYTMVAKQEIKTPFMWLFLSFMLLNAVMLPKVNIIVIDRVTGLRAPVANVPFILGVFAGIASQLGDAVTKQMDDIFSGPVTNESKSLQGNEVMEYRRHGVAMASQLVAKASRFTITDPDMAANVREFVQQCVVFDIAKGKYTIQELLSSNDVWILLKEHASQARGFPYRTISQQGAAHHIVTCAEGAENLETQWQSALSHAKKIYGARFFPHSKDAANVLASNLQISYEYLTQLSLQASDILRQNMMINAIEDGLLSYNQTTDASAAITGYAVTRAQEQQKTAYALEGKMASLSLSVLKIVIEVVFYGIFPIIIVITILPGGVAVLKKYVIALFWIQSWGPLYSILNMLVNTFGKAKSVAAVTAYTGASISAATLPGLAEANEWVAAVAGYAMMSVPFLSYGLIHYGAGALSQLSTHFGSVTQSAASHAAEEATTGNYHMGNTNFDNHSRHNISGFKHDTNALVATGRSTVQMADGSMISSTGSGDTVFDRNSAISRIGGNVNFSQSLSNSFSEMAENSEQQAYAAMASVQDNITSATQEMHDYRHNKNQGNSIDNSMSHGESVLSQGAFSRYVDKVEHFAKDNKISFDEANMTLTSAALGIQGSIGIKSMSGTGRAEFIKQYNGTDTKSEIINKAKSYSQKEGLNQLLQQSISDSKDLRINENNSEGDAYSKGIAAHLTEAGSHLTSASYSTTQSQQLREAAQFVNNEGVAFNQDLSQRYVNWLSEQTQNGEKLGAQGVQHVLAEPTINQRYMNEFARDEAEHLYNNWETQKNRYNQPTASFDATEIRNDFANDRVKVKKQAAQLDNRNTFKEDMQKQVNTSFEQSQPAIHGLGSTIEKGYFQYREKVNQAIENKSIPNLGKIFHKKEDID